MQFLFISWSGQPGMNKQPPPTMFIMTISSCWVGMYFSRIEWSCFKVFFYGYGLNHVLKCCVDVYLWYLWQWPCLEGGSMSCWAHGEVKCSWHLHIGVLMMIRIRRHHGDLSQSRSTEDNSDPHGAWQASGVFFLTALWGVCPWLHLYT